MLNLSISGCIKLIAFAKYKPLFDYSGNDTTNIQPAPLDIYKVFFNAVHELIYGQSENIFDGKVK